MPSGARIAAEGRAKVAEAELTEAEAALKQARAEADTLAQAVDAAPRSAGLLTRLRAAWRGE